MTLEDDVAFGRHLELFERVEHRQQVERRLIELVDRERFLEHLAGFGLVAGAQELHAERRKRADVVRIDLERLAAQRDGFFESIVGRRELRRDAIGAAETRVDLERRRRFLLKVGVTIFDVRDGAAPREGVEAGGINRFRFRDRRLGGLAIALVELELRLQQMRLDHIGIERQRLLDRLLGRRRIHVEERLRHPDERRNPLAVGRERILKRLRRLGVVVDVQEELSPSRMQRRIVRAPSRWRCDTRRWRAEIRRARGPRGRVGRIRPATCAGPPGMSAMRRSSATDSSLRPIIP